MAECLVTTLKDSVTDESLMKLGDIVFHANIPSGYTGVRGFWINLSDASNITYDIIGDGYFTDSTGTSNFGKHKIVTPSDTHITYLSDGEYDIKANPKYPIINLGCNANVSVNVDDLRYSQPLQGIQFVNSTGNLDNLPLSDVTTSLNISNSPALEGNINTVGAKIPNCANFWIGNSPKITGNISGLSTFASKLQLLSLSRCNVNGDISVLSGATQLTQAWLQGTNVSGNLSSLANDTALTKLALDNTAVTGDTSSLANLTNLTTFAYTNTAITGTWPLT